MTIFEFKDYRKFLLDRQKTLPARGRGELTRIAKATGVHTTMVSHVLKGTSDFSLEQSLKLADYLGFSDLETDYLVAIVQLARAGDPRTRSYCKSRVEELRQKGLNLKDRLQVKNELSEEDRAIFYSSPMFAVVRLLTAIERFQTFEALRVETNLKPRRLRQILDFLVSRKLCEQKGHKYMYYATPTYIESSSLLVNRHHLNWRQKSQENIENLREEDLMFTYPTVISESDFQVIREKLTQFINEFKKKTAPSPCENLYCLNIDWFKVSGEE